MNKTKILCILDGFGLDAEKENNPVYSAKMPIIRQLLGTYPWITLCADGEEVGQEELLVGNSEVGHMNIGGLKLVPQLSYQITTSSKYMFDDKKALEDGKQIPDQNFDPALFLSQNKTKSNSNSNSKDSVIHLVGLFSTGTIHSDLRHFGASIDSSIRAGISKIILHLISDGRDSDPHSLVEIWDTFVRMNTTKISLWSEHIFLGSVAGRYYSMDRDTNWTNTMSGLRVIYGDCVGESDFIRYLSTKSIDLNPSDMVGKNDIQKIPFDQIQSTLQTITQKEYPMNGDETLIPIGFWNVGKNDTIWTINHRSDRMKQLIEGIDDINRFFETNNQVLGMNNYGNKSVITKGYGVDIGNDDEYGYYPVFQSKPVMGTLSEYISSQNKSQLHIAESEKYNHVTYFLNGGQNKKSLGEDWCVIPSNKVVSHAEKPEMKAEAVTDCVINCLKSKVRFELTTADEQEEVLRYVREYWRNNEVFWHGGLGVSENDFDATINKYYQDGFSLSDDKLRCYFVYDGQVRIGMTRVEYNDESNQLYIYDLYVFVEYQGRGYGKVIVEYVEYLAQSSGYSTLGLTVDSQNQHAISLYTKCGFVQNESSKAEWVNKEETIVHYSDVLYMVKEVGSHLSPKVHYDYIIINYANPDMVGHTGDVEACVKTLEHLDSQLGRIVQLSKEGLCDVVIVADHGNIERVGKIKTKDSYYFDTQHNPSPVPCIFLKNDSDINEIYKSLISLADNHSIPIDRQKLDLALHSYSRIDLSNPSDWLENNTIQKPSLELWYSGLFLLAI